MNGRWQFRFACVLTYLGLAAYLFLIWAPASCVALIVQQPARVIQIPAAPMLLAAPMLFLVLSLGWLTELVITGGSARRGVAWSIVSVIFVSMAFGSSLSCIPLDWTSLGVTLSQFAKPGILSVVSRPPALIMYCLIALFAMTSTALLRNDIATEEGDNVSPDFARWARVATVLIMILAMFGYGLEFKIDRYIVKWDEVPAILIVFVLAELGVSLLVASMKIQNEVREASARALSAVGQAQQLTKSSIEASLQQEQLTQQFNQMTSIADICQIASKRDPGIAPNNDPLVGVV